MNHEVFQAVLNTLVQKSGVGQEVFGEVLARVSRSAPDDTSRLQIGQENADAGRPVDQRHIPQATVSKAVKALLTERLLEEGDAPLKSEAGRRPLQALRFGRDVIIAGVHIAKNENQPSKVTTALVGLDSSRVLTADSAEIDTSGDGAQRWDEAARTVHHQVKALLEQLNAAKSILKEESFALFGIGVEVGAPVHNGVIMPAPGTSREPIDLEAKLRKLFDPDPALGPVPIVVENDVNALTVLATHDSHYTHPDLGVVTVFDQGVGGGLVMDGRLRRGGNGNAMEIGHLPVGYAPGDRDTQQPNQTSRGDSAPPRFARPCWCGEHGHVDTRATPSRILDELLARGLTYDSFAQAASVPATETYSDKTNEVFVEAGSALGRAIAHVCNIVNPTKLVVYLPEPLAKPVSHTAAAEYLPAAKREIGAAFANIGQRIDDYFDPRPLPRDEQGIAILGAQSAAICVLESFIEHALRLDRCKVDGPRRTSRDTNAA